MFKVLKHIRVKIPFLYFELFLLLQHFDHQGPARLRTVHRLYHPEVGQRGKIRANHSPDFELDTDALGKIDQKTIHVDPKARL